MLLPLKPSRGALVVTETNGSSRKEDAFEDSCSVVFGPLVDVRFVWFADNAYTSLPCCLILFPFHTPNTTSLFVLSSSICCTGLSTRITSPLMTPGSGYQPFLQNRTQTFLHFPLRDVKYPNILSGRAA